MEKSKRRSSVGVKSCIRVAVKERIKMMKMRVVLIALMKNMVKMNRKKWSRRRLNNNLTNKLLVNLGILIPNSSILKKMKSSGPD